MILVGFYGKDQRTSLIKSFFGLDLYIGSVLEKIGKGWTDFFHGKDYFCFFFKFSDGFRNSK